MDQAVLGGAKQLDKRQQAETDVQKFHLDIRKEFFILQVAY